MSYCSEIVERLSRVLNPVSEAQKADAAVALLLKPTSRDFEVLLVKRVETPGDPWSGQMAFPGGKRDWKDGDLKQTVIRETLEETGVDVTHHSRFLGVLETVRSSVKPKLLVAPFVILLEHEPTVTLNEELEGSLWVRLKKLEECKGTAKLAFGEVPAYLVGGNVVWGLTHKVLEKFNRVLHHVQ
ncbi:MAG: NUDIX hydrolase [Candidatus Bathyarchaeia archaeon]